MRTIFSQVKSSRIPAVLGLCAADARLRDYINEAQHRLMMMGLFWGSFQSYRVCVTDGCLTWPRGVAAIEAAAICDYPLQMRSQWFEFLPNGPWLQEDGVGTLKLLDRGTAPGFDDIAGDNKLIRVSSDVAEAGTARILLQGYDENGQWIRTQDGAVWVDGEYVAISTTPTNSTKTFSQFTGAIKPVTNGPVRLYEYDSVTTDQRALAFYEADETTPVYRRSQVIGFDNISCEGSTTKNIKIMAKLEHIPIPASNNDNSWLIIGNIPALKAACIALRKEENNLWDEATKYWASAVKILNDELAHYRGSPTLQLKTEHASTFGAGMVEM